MLRLAMMGRNDSHERYRRIVSRMRAAAITVTVGCDAVDSRRPADGSVAETCVGSFDELFLDRAPAFDAVLVHSDHAFLEKDFLRAAQAGKHILYEGSLPLSSAIIRQVVDACRDAGVRVMLGPGRRFSPAVRTVKESLDAGRLGAPGLLRIHQWRPRPVDPHPKPETLDANPFQSLLDQLIAEIDLACWFFAGLPSVVYAAGRPGEYVQLHLGFAEGGMALIDLSVAMPAGDPYFSLSLIGSTGAAYADDHQNMQLLYRGGAPAALSGGTGEAEAAAQLHEFFGAINEDREPSFSGRDVLRAMKVAEAAAIALATGRAAPMKGDS